MLKTASQDFLQAVTSNSFFSMNVVTVLHTRPR